MKLSFTHIYADDKFIVEFDSESLERNLLQTVSFEGFNLDVPDLRSTHPVLYAGIKKEMQHRAEEHWRPVNKEIMNIPTLAYQMVTMLFLVMISVCTFAQPTISFEGQNHGFGLNAGFAFNRIETNIGYDAPLSRKASIPYTFYGSIGYNILRSDDYVVIPALGFSKYHEETDPEKGVVIDKGALFSCIEAGKNFTTRAGNDGRYYLFARHSVRMFVGAGLKIFID